MGMVLSRREKTRNSTSRRESAPPAAEIVTRRNRQKAQQIKVVGIGKYYYPAAVCMVYCM